MHPSLRSRRVGSDTAGNRHTKTHARRSATAVRWRDHRHMRLRVAGVTLTVVLTSCAVGDATGPTGPTGSPVLNPTSLPSVAATPASSVPSAEPASEPASAYPSPTEAADPGLRVLAWAVNGLRLRAGPSLTAEPLSYRCTGIYVRVPADCPDPIAIEAGRTMLVFDGPVAVDGFDWYLVVMPGTEPGADQLGWVATPHQGDVWLVRSELECPTSASDPDAVGRHGGGHACLLLPPTRSGARRVGRHRVWLQRRRHVRAGVAGSPVRPHVLCSFHTSPSMGDQPLFLHYPAR